jgi:TonB-dependent receptor
VLGRYSYGPTTNVKALREYFAANPANFVFNQNSATDINVPGTYVATEDIAAAYGMASIEFSRGTLVAGVRVENTKTEYDSFSVTTTPAGARVVTPVSSSGDYSNLYPSLVYTHRFTDRLLLRAAWTNAISRPDYGDLTLARIVSDSSNTIREGNPDIKPLESMNFDLSLEWYLKSAGVVSVGVFHKELENFRFLATSSITYDAGTGPEPFTLQRPKNGPKGSFTGVEFAWTQRLTFLPKPFDGFGITANLALIEAESELPGRGKVDAIPDQLDRITNFTLDYEKRGFTARAAYNYNGVSVFAFGANAAADQFTDHEESFDVSFGYTVRQGIQLFLDGKNLTDSPKKRYFIGNDTRPIEQEYTGYSIIGGVKFDF